MNSDLVHVVTKMENEKSENVKQTPSERRI
jgi:hypothetical protein